MGLLVSRFLSYTAGDQNKSAELHIVSREEWSARPSRQVVEKPSPPISYKKVLTGTKECNTKGECARWVKRMQNIHMDLMNLHDIGYSFLVGGDGNVFEGRGWKTVCNCTIPENDPIDSNIKPEENSDDDAQSITIAYIGNKETDVMKEAVSELLEYGRKYKYFGESKQASNDVEES